MRRVLLTTVGVLLIAMAAFGQSVTLLNDSGLTGVKGNHFFRLSTNGSKLLVNRSPTAANEELAVVPTSGGDATVWFSSPGRLIYDRIALSGDGSVVAFAKGTESTVYALTGSGSQPRAAANVAPFTDPRQLRLSDDGKWVAFSASRLVQSGSAFRVVSNLFVAATDGSVCHKIRGTDLVERMIAFDLSPDGSTIVWVDDPTKGPWVASRDGTSAVRLNVSATKIVGVAANLAATRIYYQDLRATGIRICSVNRDGSGAQVIHESAAGGRYEVAGNAGAVRLRTFEAKRTPPGTSWLVGTTTLTRMFDYPRADVAGTNEWSGNGEVAVWRVRTCSGTYETRIWRSSAQ